MADPDANGARQPTTLKSLFGAPGPRWFSIPADRPFAEDLAQGLFEALTVDGPEGLSDALLLTPTRRGARALSDGFLKAAGGRPVLLPQIRAVGDLDEGEPPFEPGGLALDLPPAVSSARRRFELARLVVEHGYFGSERADAGAALEMADALGRFLDSVHIEEVADPERVATLVQGDFAEHWRRSAAFLAVALEAWPRRLAELGLVDPSWRRAELSRLLARQWSEAPPTVPLIAAGSTGTAPATAALLGVVARASQGLVVLPGLDLELAEDAWAAVDESHPQGAMKRLLARHGVAREAVRVWPASVSTAAGRARRRLIHEALRPAEATADWLSQIAKFDRERDETGVDPVTEGLQGLHVVQARHEEEAAAAIALLLRETLERDDEATCALVTPDQALARRVSARLARWGVEADSSAGAALAGQPVGRMLSVCAGLIADPLDPVLWLAALKHPATRFGRDPETGERALRRLEKKGLRGARPVSVEALFDRLERPRRGDPEVEAAVLARAFCELLVAAEAPFTKGQATVPAAAEALTRLAEALCGPALWSGQAGEAAAAIVSELIEHGDALPEVTAEGFADLVETLLAGETVRAGGASHPRLRILGAIEARLVRADRLVLAGLEEGVWPAAPPVDPFLSRPMRADLGLPAPERRVGLSAHDFAQAACAGEVYLVHCTRRAGAPAVESRWLWRLRTLAKGAERGLPERPELLAWARALDAAIEPPPPTLRPAARPEPRPPAEARPRELPVTMVEKWVRDPYAVYAARILNLRSLDRPGAAMEATARGTAVHAAFERLVKEHPELSPETTAAFEAMLLEELTRAGTPSARMARERPLAKNLAVWALEFETRRRACSDVVVERQGSLTFEAPIGPFTLTAKPDRLEVCEGVVHVLDFKTGSAPSAKAVKAGFYPQLTLAAAIAARGGFPDVPARPPGDLVYVRLTGRDPAGEEVVRVKTAESEAEADKALDGLKRRVAEFDDPSTPYRSWVAPQFIGKFKGDFDHLARLYEWHVVGDGDGDADNGEGGE